MSIAAVAKSDVGAVQAALLGVTTPLSDLSLQTGLNGIIFAVVSVRSGVLGADLAPGAIVRGSGSNTLWISGNEAQVNMKLASLTYTGMAAGTDELDLLLIDGQASSPISVRSPLHVLPLVTAADPANATVVITQGTLTLDTKVIDGPVISLNEGSGSQVSTAGILANSTIGAHSTLAIRNDNAIGAVASRLAIAGRVELDGLTFFSGNGSAVTLAAGASLVNEGSMLINAHAAQFTGTGRLVNNGIIRITGDQAGGAPVRIDTALDGAGRVVVSGGATLALKASVGASETILLDAGDNTLRLAQPAGFAGTIAGFSIGERIVFEGVTATSAFYSRGAERNDGALTLLDGQRVVGTLHFSAPEPGTTFQLGSDAGGNATVFLQPVASPTQAASVDVYRFFDSRTGTQVLTSDRTERDSIIGARPDLHYEGVGLHAIAPAHADADTVAVYRFFVSGEGTYFMTASANERDTLLTTRSDLVFEPTSTMFEHATARAGDVPVFRFFDRGTGAHFFTADAGEQASILSSRPDLTSEGIAFYAPA